MGYIRTMLFGRKAVGRVGSSRMLTLPMVGSTSSTGPCARIDARTPTAITEATATRTARKRNATKGNSCIIFCACTTHTTDAESIASVQRNRYRAAAALPARRASMTREHLVKHVNSRRVQSEKWDEQVLGSERL